MKFLKTIAPAALTELWEKVSGNIVPKDTDANVGIGTDDPSTKLEVELGDDEVVSYVSSAQNLFQFWKEGATEEARMNIKHGAVRIQCFQYIRQTRASDKCKGETIAVTPTCAWPH